MNPHLASLQLYPFQKLDQLYAGLRPPRGMRAISLAMGEPKHPTPALITDTIGESLGGLAAYPTTKGLPELRQAIANWLIHRFQLPARGIDPEHQILPVSGTREALFACAQAIIDPTCNPRPRVVMPNPFYQIYEGAALLAGAQPYYLSCQPQHRWLPDLRDVPDGVWRECQLLYLCSPGNPTGAVAPLEWLDFALELAERHDFIIAADECYSEIYPPGQTPPPGLLQAAVARGNRDFRRCLVFHSLSKRSNAPGLRSGFVAGDAEVIQGFFQYRTYHGCAMPLHHQHASIKAWCDETHVMENRLAYQAKFDAMLKILDGCLPVSQPDAGFYLWPQTPCDDTLFARDLFAEQHLSLLPGQYLSRGEGADNPGKNRVRMALVPPIQDCIEAANRIKTFVRDHFT